METRVRGGPGRPTLTGEVILHDSNAELQCVTGFAHKLHLTQLVSNFWGAVHSGRGGCQRLLFTEVMRGIYSGCEKKMTNEWINSDDSYFFVSTRVLKYLLSLLIVIVSEIIPVSWIALSSYPTIFALFLPVLVVSRKSRITNL